MIHMKIYELCHILLISTLQPLACSKIPRKWKINLQGDVFQLSHTHRLFPFLLLIDFANSKQIGASQQLVYFRRNTNA